MRRQQALAQRVLWGAEQRIYIALFNEATVHLKDGKSFKVIAHNNSRDNKYVRNIVLNGNKLETPFFTHQDIVDGGTLELTMGSEPLK